MSSSQPPNRDDQSLLDRLNALKPTSVTLESSANPASVTGSEAQPESREDALTARLRVLRSQSSGERPGEGAPQAQGRPPQQPSTPDSGRDGAGAAAATSPLVDRRANAQPSSVSPKDHRGSQPSNFPYQIADSSVDDEEAVDELLEALADEHFELTAEENVAPASPHRGPDDEAAEKKASDLLRSQRRDTGPSGDNDDPDDSDGEQMKRDVEAVLSQIQDEIRSLPPPGATSANQDDSWPTGSDGQQQQKSGETDRAGTELGKEGSPEAAGDEATDKPGDSKGDSNGDDEVEPSFTLPAVPSQLPGPATTATAGGDGGGNNDDFEKDISARLASLRGLGSLDELGLPSAPTFRPQDRHGNCSSVPVGKSLLRPSRYADEDQKTWCIVCLEDAAIRCIGCDNDVYCARCWKEMHVGPSAGYDERGHQWVKFERRASR
ncbi:hypothetical protein VTH82DRAFT_3672 [Thermothelomyces myriococcoides]